MSSHRTPAYGPRRLPAPPTRRGRFFRLGVVLGWLGASVGVAAAPPPGVAGEKMVLTLAPRYFDGVNLDVVVLTAPSLKLVTDTLGSWSPVENRPRTAGFALRHRQVEAVVIELYPFVGRNPGRDTRAWAEYVRLAAENLGSATIIPANAAAAASPTIGSWPTREAILFSAAGPGATAERHLVASDGARGLAIILAGPAEDLARVAADFQFLLARLEVSPAGE